MIDNVVNDIPFAVCWRDDVVIAGQPEESHFRGLAEAGFRTVIDLRGPMEPRGCDEEGAVTAAGMNYVNFPVVSGRLTDATFGEFRRLMREAPRPMFVHCQSANRVGGVLIPYLILDLGMTRDQALEESVRAGLRSMELAQIAFDYVDRANT